MSAVAGAVHWIEQTLTRHPSVDNELYDLICSLNVSQSMVLSSC